MHKTINVNSLPVIDISNCRNAQEATALLMSSPNPCIIVDNGDFATEMESPEHTPKFSIGDIVRVNRRLLEYMGIRDDGKTMTVTGMKKLQHCDFDCYAYTCTHGQDECCYTGNELELVKPK